jgi:thioester reductase-like protein
MSQLVYLKPNTIVEPLINQWYAWSHLIAPATAAMYVANSHVPMLESFVQAPQVHASALKDPAMRGGPFINYDASRLEEIQTLLERTKVEQADLIAFARSLKEFHAWLLKSTDGSSLEPFYDKVPANLRGLVELVYDTSHYPSIRLIEGLLYRSSYYDSTRQSIALSLGDVDRRSFVLSTPRLSDRDTLHLNIPFCDSRLDQLFKMRYQPKPLAEILELLSISEHKQELFSSFFTEDAIAPQRRYEGESVRIRYFGHACVLIETQSVSILCDPLVSYPNDQGVQRYSYSNLPVQIDYALITHNHQDHVMLETLLQLRHKIKTIVVPKSNSGVLVDPSLKLTLQHLGFENVHEIDELESIQLSEGAITSLPVMGEHGDLNIAAKTAYLINLKGRSILCAADSKNIEPKLYEYLYQIFGAIDVLFIGMECDGAPYTWAYGALLSQTVPRKIAQTRRLDGSDAERAIGLIQQLRPSQVYVYAMGQEPWLTFITSILYTDSSKPIVESNKLIQFCQQSEIWSERLFGMKEIHLDQKLSGIAMNTKIQPQQTVFSISEFLSELQQLDIKISLDATSSESRLKINAPKGILTPERQAKLKQYKSEIVAFLERDRTSELQAQLRAEAKLELSIEPHLTSFEFSSPQNILLTGGTGFIGAFLLHELLQQPSTQIYCLVRAENPEQAQRRIQQNLEIYQLWNENNESRIIPIVGDLSQPQFGLSDAEFQKLSAQIDTIYHNGAWVNHTLPYSTLKAANVLGTQEILRLASLVKLKPVHFISTISVFPPQSVDKTILEDCLDDDALPVMGYAQTKWVAEKLIQIGRDRRIPISIYRLGAISGDSHTGVFNQNDFLYRLIIGCVQLKSVPDRTMTLDMLPVNYVSQAIVHLSQQESCLNKTFHLTHPTPVSSEIIFQFLLNKGYQIAQKPYSEWRTQLMQIAQSSSQHILYPLVTLLPSDTQSSNLNQPSLKFSTHNVKTHLAETSIKCPAIDEQLLDTYLRYLIQAQFLEPPISSPVLS